MDAKKARPEYRAYTVVKREGRSDYWLPVGAGFAHQDGKGLSILLQALPLDGKIVLRPNDDEAKTVDQIKS
jgi:hypothetical protein